MGHYHTYILKTYESKDKPSRPFVYTPHMTVGHLKTYRKEKIKWFYKLRFYARYCLK